PDRANFIAFVGDLGARSLVRRSVGLFRTHAKFPSEGVAAPAGMPGVTWSDHWSFREHGYPAIMVTDTAFYRYPHYHLPSDTAESYGPGHSETSIAQALHPYPKDLVIGTKCGLVRPSRSRWDPDGRPEKLRQDLEGSLKRLQLERIDLYQLHAPDDKLPFADSVGALADFQREGKVRHVGLSNVTVQQLEQARKIVPIVSVQNRYNLGDRSSEDVLKACERLRIAFLPWYPLGDGSSLRKAKVKALAKKLGATPSQVTIAWLLKKSPVMLPIPGTGSVEHREENMKPTPLELG